MNSASHDTNWRLGATRYSGKTTASPRGMVDPRALLVITLRLVYLSSTVVPKPAYK
jgi:hypothetical protein